MTALLGIADAHTTHHSALRVQVLRDRAAVDAVAPAWSNLAERTGQDFTAYPAWSLACVDLDDHYERSRWRLVTVHAGPELIGVGPFVESSHAGLQIVRFAGYWMGQANRLIVAPGDTRAAAAIWSALRTPRTYLQLQSLDEDFGLATLAGIGRWATRTEERSTCRVVDASLPMAEMLRSSARKSLRKLLSSAHHHATADGVSLGHSTVEGLDGLASVLPDIQTVEATAEGDWHGRGLHGELAAGRVPEVVRRAAAETLIVTFVVRAGDRPIAYLVSLVGGGRVVAFLNGHDPGSRRYSPGHLTLAALYEFAHESGGRPVDLSVGDFEYKHRWTGDTYGVAHVVATPHRAGLELTRTVQTWRDQVREGSRAAARRTRGRSA